MAAQDDGTRTQRRRPAARPDAVSTPPETSPRKPQRRPEPEDITPLPAASSGQALQPAGKRQSRRRAAPQPDTPTPPAGESPTPAGEGAWAIALTPEGGMGEGTGKESAPQTGEVEEISAPGRPAKRRRRERGAYSNALGLLIERHFSDPVSPCRSYSDLERHSTISREALSRYVTARPDRRRSPTIDTLVAIADAMHLSIESVCRAAAASAKGVIPPPEQEQRAREEVLGTLVTPLTDEQFGAVVELLRQLHPLRGGT